MTVTCLRTPSCCVLRPNSPDRALQEHAEEMFTALSRPNTFQRQMHAQPLIEMDRPADALPLLIEVEEREITGWTRYWRSVALLAVGKSPEALTEISAALAEDDHRLASFRSSFLVQRFKVRRSGTGKPPKTLPLRWPLLTTISSAARSRSCWRVPPSRPGQQLS